jgi:hypothetical protein
MLGRRATTGVSDRAGSGMGDAASLS